MRSFSLLLFYTFFFFTGYSQSNLQWHFNNSGSSNGYIGQLKKFANGDVLIQGYNTGGDLDPGPGTTTTNSTIVFARYTSAGTMIFGRPLAYNSVFPNWNAGIEIDADGNFYFAFMGTGTFDLDTVPGIGELNLLTGSIAFVKFDAMGNYKWGFVYDDHIGINYYRILSDKSVIISGDYDYGPGDLDPGPGVFSVSTTSWNDGYLAKFDSSGNFITAKLFQVNGAGPTDNIGMAGMDIDNNDNIYQSGYFVGTFDMDPGPATYFLTGNSQSPNPHERFMVKLDNNLDFSYAYEFPKEIDFFYMVADPNNGYYMYGVYSMPLDIDPLAGVTMLTTNPNFGTYFIARFNGSGNLMWAKTMLTQKDITGAMTTQAYVDDAGMLNFEMYLNDTIVSNSFGFPQLPNNGYSTPGQYMVQLDSTGTCVYIIRLPEIQNPHTLVVDPTHFYFSGRISDPIDIQIGPNITIDAPVNVTGNEFFLSYYSRDPALNRIEGNAFLDLNSNAIRDTNENGLQNVVTEITPGNFYLSTDNLGNFGAYVPSGNYTMTIPSVPLYLTGPVPMMHDANFPFANQIDTANNFAFEMDLAQMDVAVYLTAMGNARPGMNFSYNITYANEGGAAQSGNVTVLLDSAISLVSTSVVPTMINGQQLQWNFTSLNPLQASNINLTVHVDSTALIGDTITSVAGITSLVGDNFPNNNADTGKVILTGSWDPNSKEVSPAGDITDEQAASGIDLTYTLNFQNTGNDTAFFVTLLDTLSSALDISSLRIVAASHPYYFTLYPGNLMEFRFSNILLPDSNINEPASHGFVKYKIKPKPNLIPGNIIENEAYIYFDFNLPVVTNTTQTLIVDFVGMNENSLAGKTKIYPNPFSDQLIINFENRQHEQVLLTLREISGRIVKTLETTSKEISLNGSEISNGVYLLEIKHPDYTEMVKVIKL